MIQMCSLSNLRSNLGRYVRNAGHHGDRFVILKNGREMAGLIGVADLNLLDSASTRSLEYKAYQIAEEMLRWRLIKEGLEQLKLRE
jgi:PHD/YefM family antitoxin component YafN of YafNO toxin-antitoxin module